MPDYKGQPKMAPASDAALLAIMEDSRGRGGGGPLSPRHDKPQVNVRRPAPPPKRRSKSSSNPHKYKSRKNTPIEEMDEASEEAHIVQKIEMAIKKSRAERKASIRSHSQHKSPHHHRRRESREETEMDENYQMIKSEGENHNHRSKPKRTASNKSKVNRHKPKPPLEAPPLEHTKHKSTHLAKYSNENDLSDIDGLVDDKRGFQVHVDPDQWISTNFSDPTLDTFEHNHFLGEDNKRALATMLDPQRIHCGVGGRSATDSSKSGREPDVVTSIIDRIYQKNEQTGTTYTRKQKSSEAPSSKKGAPHQPVDGNLANKKEMPAKELMSFDNYEDDDGYYYEDDEDDYPMYPSSKPPPPRPAATEIPISSMNMSSLIGFGGNGDKEAENSNTSALQTQLDEINQLHRDIQRQQDLIKQFSQISARDAKQDNARLNPHETSADVYHRELARQAQAELYRMELVQKSMMLEKQMEVYRRNQEEWNKVRDLAIKEEESRRKIVEKAKEVWQAEMRTNFAEDDGRKAVPVSGGLYDDAGKVVQGNGGLPAIVEEISKEISKSEETSQHNQSSEGSSGEHPTLYHKIAALNNQTVLTEEDQKIIEAEILKELHIELSKQAAEKKVMQKPLFFSERMRSSWSGKQTVSSDDPNKSVEQVTEELTRQIQALSLEMAPSKKSSTKRGRSRRSKDEASEKGRLPKMKLDLFWSRIKDAKTPPKAPHESRDQDSNNEDQEEGRAKVKSGRRHRAKASKTPPKVDDQSRDAPDDEVLDHDSIDDAGEEDVNLKNGRARSKAKATKTPPKTTRRDKAYVYTPDDDCEEGQSEAEADDYPDSHIKKTKARFRRLRKKIITVSKAALLSPAQAETTPRKKKQSNLANAEMAPRTKSRKLQYVDEEEEDYDAPSDDDDAEPNEDVEEYFKRQESSGSSPSNYQLIESGSSHKKHGRVPSATSSQSTQLTSNRVYIGVEGDAIEAMSFTNSKNPLSPVSKDLSCQSNDRYTTCSGEEVVMAGSNPQAPKANPCSSKDSLKDMPVSKDLSCQSNDRYITCSGEEVVMAGSNPQAPKANPCSSKDSLKDMPVSKDLSCKSHDRYTTCSGDEVVSAGSNPKASKANPCSSKDSSEDRPNKCTLQKGDDDPSIFEFLEVQYYPHEEEEAPMDEIEADHHSYRGSF